MVIVGWGILLLALMVGLRLGGIALGLLSGLGLGLLTFFGRMQPVYPPCDLLILQITWLILTATLEAVDFFYLLEAKFSFLVEKSNRYHIPFVALFCYCLAFLTGNKRLFNVVVSSKNGVIRHKLPIQLIVGMATHMALLVSPLSISGLLLFVVVNNGSLSTLGFVGMVGCVTVGITVVSSVLCCWIPYKWLTKLDKWFGCCYADDITIVAETKGHKRTTYVFLFVLLLLVEGLFFLVKPKTSASIELMYIGKIFPVRCPMFFAIMMLAIAAIMMLSFNLKPAKILQTNRFKLGIQQFFIFLGLTWLAETLISHDKVSLLKILHDVSSSGCYRVQYHIVFYLMMFAYILLVDMPMVIWLFIPLLIGSHFSMLCLAVWLVAVHSLSPILNRFGK